MVDTGPQAFFKNPQGVVPQGWESSAQEEASPEESVQKSPEQALLEAFSALEEADNKAAKVLNDVEKQEKLVKDLQVDSSTKVKDELKSVKEIKQQDYIDQLALYVKDCFDSSECVRRTLEYEWLDALRQYRGIYKPEVLAKIVPNRSRAFVRVTRTKVKTVDSRLIDLLFPANGAKNWGITPTVIPDFNENQKNELVKMYEEEKGEKITPAKLDSLIQKVAKEQCAKMSKVIEDQLAELKYRNIMREIIHSGNVYGTGILKGPLASIVENKQYYKQVSPDGAEQWLLKDYDKVIPFAESVRIWDIYPDMEVTDIDDARFIVQRRKMAKHELISLARRSDFAGEVIMQYLKDFPEGDYEKKPFELVLRTIGDVYSDSQESLMKGRKYEILEFWGYIDTFTLAQWGMEIPEDKKNWLEIPCNVWVIGNRVIKAAIHPLDGIKWPYYIYYFDKDETSIFGEGIPSVMSTMQEMINAAFRAMLDNAAISAGPQLEINLDLLSEDEDPREIHPFKVWLRTGTGLDASNPCIRSITMPSYTTEFERMLGLFGNYSDEITTIPRYMWGDTDVKGAGRTSSGLSMLMGSANMAIKDQVKNFDDGITVPFIRAMYHWNMQFNEDDDIKGDYTIIAKGSASLIAKEMYAQYLIQFLNITNNPQDTSTVKRTDIIRAVADVFDLSADDFIKSDAEIAAEKQAQEEEREKQMEFMNNIIETARQSGTSPEALISSAKQLLTAQKQAIQIQQELGQQANTKQDYRNYYFTNAPEQGRLNPTGY